MTNQCISTSLTPGISDLDVIPQQTGRHIKELAMINQCFALWMQLDVQPET